MTREKTKWIFDDEPTSPGGAGAGAGATQSAPFTSNIHEAPSTIRLDDDVTQPLEVEEKTKIWHGGRSDDEARQAAFEDDDEVDPVVGWLTIIKGPGLGRSLTLGSGTNILGRSDECRVNIAFGDDLISSKDHLRIIYDDEARVFIAVPGSGKNVCRLEKEIIVVPTRLKNYDVIALSKATAVMFVQLCGENFDWSDVK